MNMGIYKRDIFHFFCLFNPLIKYKKQLWEEAASNYIKKIVENHKILLNFNNEISYKFVSKEEMNSLLSGNSIIFKDSKEELKVPMASSNTPFTLYVCLDYIRELTRGISVSKRDMFLEGCIMHEIEHFKINDSFTDKLAEELFIVEKSRKEYPEQRKTMEELLPKHL
jgi:hypothetical protein